MKFSRSTLFEAGRALFMKNWKIFFRGKQAWFWQLNPYFNSFRLIWRTYGRQVSRKTVAKSLAACDSRRLHDQENQCDSATANISVFIEQRNISFQNDISLKTMKLGVFSREKLKNLKTQGRIVTWTSLGVRFRHVYRLDESKSFKSSVSNWPQY